MTTKGRTVLKIGLFGMLAGTMILAFGVLKTDAISYNGTSTFSAPSIYWSGGSLAVAPDSISDGIGSSRKSFNQLVGSVYVFGQYSCFKFNTGTIDGRQTNSIILKNSYTSTADPTQYVGISLLTYSTGSNSGTVNLYLNIISGGTVIGSGQVGSFNRYDTSPGLVPYDKIICLGSRFQTETASNSFQGIYLRQYSLFFFNGTNGEHYFNVVQYEENGGYGVLLAGGSLWQISLVTPNMSAFPLVSNNWWYYPLNYANEFPVKDFLTLTGSSNYVNNYAHNYFNSSTLVIGEVGASTGSTSTETDYFEDCTSFLDVGCYIEGLWNGIKSSISDWFISIFPDVTWNGGYNTCFSTGSTSTGSNLTGSGVGYIQKLANFGMVIIPLAPPDGTQYCMIGGFTGTLEYQKFVPTAYKNQVPGIGSIFDVMMLLLFGLVIISSIHKHSGRGGGGNGGEIWHDAEDIKNVVHKPF